MISRGPLLEFVQLCLFLLLATASACSPPPSVPLSQVCSPLDKLEAEEYAVLSALICTKYVKEDVSLIIIRDRTYTVHARLLENVREQMPNVPPDLLADFEAKNTEARTLKPLLTLPIRYSLVPPEKLGPIFWAGQDRSWDLIYGPTNLIRRPGEDVRGWDLFYQLYPHSQGIMTLSAPGFTSQMDTSLLYVGNQSHYLAGAGFIVLLTKENGTWIIKKEVMLWIS